jgi:hypothetical protein
MTFPFYGLCHEYPLDAATNTINVAGSTQVTSVYFARYEVQEQPNPIATAGVTFTPIPLGVHDISGNRVTNYMNGDGLTWAINSTGYIYERKNYNVDVYGEYTVPYNVYPNKVLATAKAYTEFRKLSCTLPGTSGKYAAIYATTAADANLTSPCQVGGNMANGYGLYAMAGAAGATMPTGGSSTNFFGASTIMSPGASATVGATVNGPVSDVTVFGMSLKDIQFIADYVGSSSPNIPMTIQEPYKLSYFNGNLTYGATQSSTIYQQLNSTGILCVNGNLTLESPAENSAGTSYVLGSYYSGIVFCTGNVTIENGSQLDGTLILGYSAVYPSQPVPQLAVTGITGGYAYLTADPVAVANVIQQVAQYREDITARKVLLAFPGI